MTNTNTCPISTQAIKQNYKMILDLASDGIFITDKQGKILEFSQKAKTMLQCSEEQMKKSSIYDFDLDLSKQKFTSLVQSFNDQTTTLERILTRKDGSTFFAHITTKELTINDQSYIYASVRDITKQKNNEKLLIEKTKEQESLLSLFDISDNVLAQWKYDKKWKLDYISQNVVNLLEYTKEELLNSDCTYTDFMHKDDIEKNLKEVDESIDKKKDFIKHTPYRLVTKSGKIKWVLDQTVIRRDEKGNKTFFICYISDITKEKKYEFSLKKSNEKLQAIFDTALEAIGVLDLKFNHKEINKKYEELLGYSEKEIKGKSFLDLTSPRSMDKTLQICEKIKKYGYCEDFERYCIKKDGEERRFRSSIGLMPNKKEYIMTSVDITDLHNAFEKLKTQSYIDELTGLHNRKAYNERVQELTSQFKRHNNIFSIVMFDIDFFKSINDTYGHSKGDEILQRLGKLAISTIRKSDYIFRVGGEEFTVLLTKTNKNNATIFAEKLRKKVESDLSNIPNRKITISLGVTEIKKIDSIDTLFQRADKNLYYAKNNGRNQLASHL